MNAAPKSRELKSCLDCPLWPAGTQSGFPTMEKIQLCINHVLGGRRQWIAGDEFQAQVEAHRQARLKAPIKGTKAFQPGPVVRTYVLDYARMFTPKRPVLIIPEDMP